jgi:hypothetical protein
VIGHEVVTPQPPKVLTGRSRPHDNIFGTRNELHHDVVKTGPADSNFWLVGVACGVVV